MGIYDESYPPSLWTPPAPIPSTGASTGTPGTWTPAGSAPPATVADLTNGVPNPVVATPTALWGVGTYVQTGTVGAAGQAHWDGSGWVAGVGPVVEEPEALTETPAEYTAVPVDEIPSD